jgi:hypothetical protein
MAIRIKAQQASRRNGVVQQFLTNDHPALLAELNNLEKHKRPVHYIRYRAFKNNPATNVSHVDSIHI